MEQGSPMLESNGFLDEDGTSHTAAKIFQHMMIAFYIDFQFGKFTYSSIFEC